VIGTRFHLQLGRIRDDMESDIVDAGGECTGVVVVVKEVYDVCCWCIDVSGVRASHTD
jgi:hypothetical protein